MIVRIDEHYKTEGDAKRRMNSLYYEYPPRGYGTLLQVFPPDDNSIFWRVNGSRSSSCD